MSNFLNHEIQIHNEKMDFKKFNSIAIKQV